MSLPADLMVRPYGVEVRGWPSVTFYAGSRGRALADAWRSYIICDNVSFGDFLKIAKAHRMAAHGRFGERITVAGHPAYYIGDCGQYVRFARPDSAETLLSHPADVKPAKPTDTPDDGEGNG